MWWWIWISEDWTLTEANKVIDFDYEDLITQLNNKIEEPLTDKQE